MTGKSQPSCETQAVYELSLAEMSRACGVAAEEIIVLIGEGILEPSGTDPRRWRFAPDDLVRARRAIHIQRDLGVNRAGAALAIELLDELRQLRERVSLLETLAFRR